ncbi:hypothetical protein D1007_61409 [Hordeum vulgare]|nr:hypothetical protein D1007_61409 [Hordeum vulgare]
MLYSRASAPPRALKEDEDDDEALKKATEDTELAELAKWPDLPLSLHASTLEATVSALAPPLEACPLAGLVGASKVSPTLNPNISHDDDVDDNGDENNDEESDNIASLKIKGEMIFKSLYKNKLACSNFLEIMSIATEGKKYIEELEAYLEEHEATTETMEGHEREYANEIAELSQALESEQTIKESLKETFAIELSRLKESHDRALEVANDFRTKNYKLEVTHAKLVEDYEHL